MKADFRKLKVSLVFAILLSVVLMAVAGLNNEDTASAQLNLFDTTIELERDTGNATISPGDPAVFELTVDYDFVADFVPAWAFKGSTNVQLEIIEGNEEWVTPTLSKRTFPIEPGEEKKVTLTVDITPEAPYLQNHNIIIRATAEEKLIFQEAVGEISLTINPEFLYFVDANSLSNYAEVTPGETHEFKVNIVNDASYTVKYYFKTQGVQADWVVSAPDSLTVGPKSKEQVTVSVAPPYDFGYHDEIEDFQVEVTAAPFPSAGGYDEKTVDTLNFQVKNRGFSSSASGGGILIIAGIIIAVIVVVLLVLFMFSNVFKKKR